MSNNTILEVEKEKDNEVLDPTEASAYFINESHKQFRQLVYTLSERKKRSVARVLEAVLFEPLERIELFGDQEEQLFALCQQIMYNKGVVLQYAMEKHKNKLEKQGDKANG